MNKNGNMPTKGKENNEEIKSQSITMSTIIGKAIEAVVAYIVLWFFKPLWDNVIEWWKKRNDSNK